MGCYVQCCERRLPRHQQREVRQGNPSLTISLVPKRSSKDNAMTTMARKASSFVFSLKKKDNQFRVLKVKKIILWFSSQIYAAALLDSDRDQSVDWTRLLPWPSKLFRWFKVQPICISSSALLFFFLFFFRCLLLVFYFLLLQTFEFILLLFYFTVLNYVAWTIRFGSRIHLDAN